VSASNKKVGSSFSAVGKVVAALGLAKLGKEAFDIALAYDKINNSLKTVTGSQAGANAEFAFLEGLADDLGVQIPSIAEGYTRLYSAMQGAGIATSVTRELTQGVAELSTAMGLGSSETSGLTRALSQIAAKGKVSSEELQQLAERGVDAFGLASRAIGVTTKELTKMLERGEIISSDFLPKFGKQMRLEFGDAAQEASNSAQAAVNRMSNAWEKSLTGMGNAISKFIPIATSLLNTVNSVGEAVGETATGFSLWIDELMGVVDTSGDADTAAIELGRKRRLAAQEAKKNADAEREYKKALEESAKEAKKVEGFGELGKKLIFNEQLEEMAEKLKLTKSELKSLGPIILQALGKGADLQTVEDQVISIVKHFKNELNTIQPLIEDLSTPFDAVLKKATQLQEAMDMSKVLGLNKKEFDKIKGTLIDAINKGVSIDQIKAKIAGLRDVGFFDEEQKKVEQELPKLTGTTVEAGTAAATEFLKQSELDVTRNDMLAKLVKQGDSQKQIKVITK
jgi:tape measure domain-containing protein